MQVLALDVGDIQIRAGGQTIAIIERKTVADLEASICDGRYREQKVRLKTSPAHIFYLVEGDVRLAKRLPEDTLRSALCHLSLRDGFRVIRTLDLEDTARTVIKLFAKRELLDNSERALNAVEGRRASYGATAPVRRARDIGPGDAYLLMLRQVPGVSPTIARRLQAAYPSMQALVRVYSSDGGAKSIANLTYERGQSSRRIGPVVATRLRDFLLSPSQSGAAT